jgi:DNA (cytosine-5)-methyltransferase 1
MIVDLFAGPGGWSEGLRMLAPDLHATELGFEWDAAACETRAAAGHATIRTDIAAYALEQFGDRVTGLIASPPCQDFSLAGKRAGIEGERGQLITEVLRWAEALRPEWIACEQVPPALPIWRDYEVELRRLGFFTWSGVLNAADYGVPQTRRRAILLAHRDRPVGPPDPTHDRKPVPSLFGDALLPWVTMADALGWGFNARPSTSLVAQTNQLNGGARARLVMTDAIESGKWVLNPGMTESQPARRLYGLDEPAPTVAFGHDAANWKWEPVDWSVNTGRAWVKGGSREDAQTVPATAPAPAPTISGQTDAWWFTRPSTTIVGSFCPDIIAGPGVDLTRPRQNREGSVRIDITDALVLQSFPADYPIQGSKTKQFQQVGNAVPPRLAAHILAAVTGRTFTP